MNKVVRILVMTGLSAFISGHLVYADAFNSFSTELSKLGTTTLDNVGTAIKPLKNITGDFVSKYTAPAFGEKVKNSSWRNVFTSSTSRAIASGILKGVSAGIQKGSGYGANVAFKETVNKNGLTGIQRVYIYDGDVYNTTEELNYDIGTTYEIVPDNESNRVKVIDTKGNILETSLFDMNYPRVAGDLYSLKKEKQWDESITNMFKESGIIVSDTFVNKVANETFVPLVID